MATRRDSEGQAGTVSGMLTIMEAWMTRQEAAAYLRTTTKTVDRLVSRGSLPRHYLNGSAALPRFRKQDLDDLMTTEPREDTEA